MGTKLKRASAKPRPESRRRRTAEEARRAILGAAQRRLAEGGPEAIRLQEIARDLGISHPAILHHFESRDGLMRALARSTVTALDHELVVAIGDSAGATTPASVLERVFAGLGESGLARLLAWYALSRFTPDADHREQFVLKHLAEALRLRLEHEPRGKKLGREEAQLTVRLAAVAVLGDAIFGGLIDHSFGTIDGPANQKRFRAWLAELLGNHLELRDGA